MDAFIIQLEKFKYAVRPSQHGQRMIYVVNINGSDIDFSVTENGDILPISIPAEKIHILIGRAIESHFC